MNLLYQPQDRKPSSFIKWWVVLFGIGVLVVLWNLPAPSPLVSYVHSFDAVVQQETKALASTGSYLLALLSSKESLLSANHDLRQELEQTGFNRRLLEEALSENARLRQVLSLTGEYESMLAQVIRRPPETIYDSIVLSLEDTSRVAVGDLVVYERTALGEIVGVYEGTVTARLFSSPGEERTVFVTNGSSTLAARLVGMGGGSYEVFVSRDQTLPNAPLVLLPDQAFFVLGMLEDVVANPNDAFQVGRFSLPISLQLIDFVHIVPVRESTI